MQFHDPLSAAPSTGAAQPAPTTVFRRGTLCRPLAALALFHTNLEASWDSWWLYFFPYFFMGVVIHHAVHHARSPRTFVLYALLFVAAMAFEWRWRLLSALLVGVLLWHAEWRGWGARWPAWVPDGDGETIPAASGPTMLIAGLRCIVTARLGPTVDVPQELVP